MSSKIDRVPKTFGKSPRGASAAPPPVLAPESVHLDVLELTKAMMAMLEYLTNDSNEYVELADELKPILERILR